jgi:hypothetical protein
VLDKLGQNLGLRGLREEVGEDVPERIPRGRKALMRQIAVLLKNGESIQDTIFIQFLVPGIVLTHLLFWRKEVFINIRNNSSTTMKVEGQKGEIALLENLLDCISRRVIMSLSRWMSLASLSVEASSAA